MSLINREKAQSVLDAVHAEWNRLLESVKATYNEWALTLPSTTATENYKWADLLVEIREWIGDRMFGHLRLQDWTVKNEKYEGSFTLQADDINDDKLGMLVPQTDSLYNAALFFPQRLLEQVALAGFNTACYDGQFFFDDEHPALTADGSTVSNVGTDALDYDAVRAVLNEHFLTILGSTGMPLDLDPYAIMVGPSLLGTAQSLFADEKKPNSLTESNQLRGRLKPVLNRRFVGDYANYWIVLAKIRNTSLTPFAYQEREKPMLVSSDMGVPSQFAGVEGQDYIKFMRDEIGFGTDFRGAATFTFWALAYASTGSGVPA